MADDSILSRPGPIPYFTFLIKGLISCGKSTLLNAILSQNVSKTSIKRQTMCQAILTESSSAGPTDAKAIYDHIHEINQKVYQWTEKGNSIHQLTEVDLVISRVSEFLPRPHNIDYRYIETVGFDDPKTDPANLKWFRRNTKWSDVLLFVTDKEKCMNTLTEQNLLKDTIQDLIAAKREGKLIPLVVVINKVEESDDPEIMEMIEQCKVNVRRIMQNEFAADHPVEFATISAMTALYYRMFRASWSFEGMEQKDISRLAEIELGRQGKTLAKDPSKHRELAKKLREHMEADPSIWQNECGINNLCQALNTLLLREGRPAMVLTNQLRLQLAVMKAKHQKAASQEAITASLDVLMASCASYSTTISGMRVHSEITRQLAEIKLESGRFFEQLWKQYCNALFNVHSAITSISASLLSGVLEQLTSFQRSKSAELIGRDGWASLRKDSIIMALMAKWSGRAGSTDFNTASSAAATLTEAVAMLLEVATQAHRESHYETLSFLLTEAITPMVTNMNATVALTSIQVGPSGSSASVLFHLESGLMSIYKRLREPETAFESFCLLFIKKKLILRDSLPGYGISLRELLETNPRARQRRFFLFFRVLHGPVSHVDSQWAESLAGCGDEGYYEHIVNNSFLSSERQYLSLVCGDVTSSTGTDATIVTLDDDDEAEADADVSFLEHTKENTARAANARSTRATATGASKLAANALTLTTGRKGYDIISTARIGANTAELVEERSLTVPGLGRKINTRSR